MQQPRPAISYQPTSSQVLFRLGFRLVALSVLANLGTQGFGITLSMLLAMSAIFCAIVGATRREDIFGPALTHWDEAVTYAALSHLVGALT
jgi:hypothetical protein